MQEDRNETQNALEEARRRDMERCDAYFDGMAKKGGAGARLKRALERTFDGGHVAALGMNGALGGLLGMAAFGLGPLAVPAGAALLAGGGAVMKLASKTVSEDGAPATGTLPQDPAAFKAACLKRPSPAERLAGGRSAAMTWAERMVGSIHVLGMVHALSDMLPVLKDTEAWEPALKAASLGASKPVAEFSPKDFRTVLNAVKACDALPLRMGRVPLAEEIAEARARTVFLTPFACSEWKHAVDGVYEPDWKAQEAMETVRSEAAERKAGKTDVDLAALASAACLSAQMVQTMDAGLPNPQA